jgi:hypothetical protein
VSQLNMISQFLQDVGAGTDLKGRDETLSDLPRICGLLGRYSHKEVCALPKLKIVSS